eukprot:2806788-Amphidinium_carterae.1
MKYRLYSSEFMMRPAHGGGLVWLSAPTFQFGAHVEVPPSFFVGRKVSFAIDCLYSMNKAAFD